LRCVQTVVLVWQVSHWRVSGMWVVPWRSAPANTYEPLWQVEHSPTVPVWFMNAGLNATKLVWHVSHCCVVGTWLVGFERPVPPGVWQVEQLPNAVASCV